MSPLSDAQRLVRRAKQSERDLGHWLVKHDGFDPLYRGIASPTTGRVGHVTGLQFDNVSTHYAAENKRVRIGKRFMQWWLQINDVATDRHKDALLSIEPTNVLTPTRKIPRLHIITEDRHAELLRAERQRNVLESLDVNLEGLMNEAELEEFNR